MDFNTRYKKLNERQRQAVDTIDGPLMVVAGPGTGKTELLSMRVAAILQRTDTAPESILCLTFTESGAAAMRKRLAEIIGKDAYKVAIHTFHSFGSDIISRYGEFFYHGATFRPASGLHSYELLRSIFDSLDFSNPLSSKMNGEYTHLPDTLTSISELKKSGLTNEELLQLLDANDATLDDVEPLLQELFSARISSKTALGLAPIARRLSEREIPSLPPGISPLSRVLAVSLHHALEAAEEQESTKPITTWKNAHFEKNESGQLVFKDRKRSQKLRSVSYLYYQYLVQMQEAELYDFDDMVLRVVHAIEVFPELLYALQEKYLYVMVDEFQDTNLAQARILYNLTQSEAHDNPNIMVVGDDDQAIYSFQGADVGNIIGFRDQYPTAKIVTLIDNYRSANTILEQSRAVITQGRNRLELHLDEINKQLTAHRSSDTAQVVLYQYERVEDERRHTASTIKKQINSGVAPGSIAVLARRHHELLALLPYFAEAGISVNYERRDNVLESDVVVQLQLIARIACAIGAGELGEADALLPRLLAHPAWNFAAEDIWQLSIAAYKHRGGWLEEMATMPVFMPLHEWLLKLANQALHEPAERVIDHAVGFPSEDRSDGRFHSPLYPYFFSDSNRTQSPDDYVSYLEALRTIRSQIQDYRPNTPLSLQEFVDFIQLHDQLGQTITSVRMRSDAAADSVHLMTAHKSKGLEFDHVYIIGAVDSAWGEQVRVRSRLIRYPDNLPISPSGDTPDERLRLFFVAMTRARQQLHISYSTHTESGKETLPASFLSETSLNAREIPAIDSSEQLIQELRSEWYRPFAHAGSGDIRKVLTPSLENYRLSITHLTSFLDITRGGPNYFLLNNLLHFPTVKHPTAQYGTAIHEALQRAHSHYAATGKRKPVEDVLNDFETQLATYRLNPADQQSFTSRGVESLSAFLAEKYSTFEPTQRVEVSFAGQQSRVGEATLTGAIDVMNINEQTKSIEVIDYKTGHAAGTWKGKSDAEKLKLHRYRQQLLFYKLLVERSRDYHSYTVTSGALHFVEPTHDGRILSLDVAFDAQELADFSQLIESVYALITTLTLPDISVYPATYKGTLAFEDDIRMGKY